MGNEINYAIPGLIGVLVHVLSKMHSTMVKKKGNFSYRIFLNATWPTAVINLSLVLGGNYLVHVVPSLANGNVLVIVAAFFTGGYTGQSLVDKLLRKYLDKYGIKDDAAKVLPLLLLPLLLASCANERRFVRYHEKQPMKAIGHCAIWAPVKESTITKVVTKPGKTVTVAGEPVYIAANCDSAYRAAYDEAIRLGQKGRVVVPPVRVRVPAGTERVDTVLVAVTRVEENTALVTSLKYKMDGIRRQADAYEVAYKRWRKWGYTSGSILGLLAVAGVAYGYYRLKASYINKAKNMMA